jgi:hypothetical protein
LRFHVDKNFVFEKNLFDEANMAAGAAGGLAHFAQMLALFAQLLQLAQNQALVTQGRRKKKIFGLFPDEIITAFP